MIKEYKNIVRVLTRKKIHYSSFVSWNRDRGEGYNEGITACIKYIESKINKLKDKESINERRSKKERRSIITR